MIGLNESVRSSLFKEVCSGIGPVHSMKFHRHPKTKTFLGAATVSFVHAGVGKTAVTELDGKVIGGCYLRAELDDSGESERLYQWVQLLAFFLSNCHYRSLVVCFLFLFVR